MNHVMEIFTVMFCVFTGLVASISVSPNGNSPEIKMIGGIMVDSLKRQITVKPTEGSVNHSQQKIQQSGTLLTKLAINERYRRLIPYMTFYYANNLTTPRTDNRKIVEVEKAEIVEANEFEEGNQRQPKKIINLSSRVIPRYQGNRLAQIASGNPTKIFYRDGVPLYQNPNKVTTNFNPLLPDYVLINSDYNTRRIISKPLVKPHFVPNSSVSRKPYLNIYKPDDTPNVRYYLSEKEMPPKYKLVPYEQTPPVKVVPQNENVYETKKPYVVSVLMPREQVYIKPKPTRPQYFYDSINAPPEIKKHPVIVTEHFYEKQSLTAPHLIENGFKPILNPTLTYTTELPDYALTTPQTYVTNSEHKKQNIFVETPLDEPVAKNKENLYQYIVEDHTYNPVEYTRSNAINLATLLNSLQQNQSIPKPITRENVGSSIRTLLQALNALEVAPKEIYHQSPVLSTPKPFVPSKNVIDATYTILEKKPASPSPNNDKNEEIYNTDEPYLAPVKYPSQHIDDFQTGEGTVQHFPLPVTSDEEGGTPGRPGIDYPILTTIPHTVFDCKTQRYKGFFADPETRCQVWHYCDLNGGQASFLCPNGTIFSQAGLTCDWWFNVRCASTAQLYVLNESLYKYILPHSPKFPEDFSGPLVDKYLTLKFKEMEEEFKKNKNKQKTDKVENEESADKGSDDIEKNEYEETSSQSALNVASVVVESAGATGNVERLRDE